MGALLLEGFDLHFWIKRIVTIFGQDLLDAAGCLTFGKSRKNVVRRGNQSVPVQVRESGSARQQAPRVGVLKAMCAVAMRGR
jgi:hypothetical protein